MGVRLNLERSAEKYRDARAARVYIELQVHQRQPLLLI